MDLHRLLKLTQWPEFDGRTRVNRTKTNNGSPDHSVETPNSRDTCCDEYGDESQILFLLDTLGSGCFPALSCYNSGDFWWELHINTYILRQAQKRDPGFLNKHPVLSLSHSLNPPMFISFLSPSVVPPISQKVGSAMFKCRWKVVLSFPRAPSQNSVQPSRWSPPWETSKPSWMCPDYGNY